MAELSETTESNTAEANYDTSFAIDDYRRYFKYDDQKIGDIKTQFGICRKCRDRVPRKDGNTSGMLKHAKKCDSEAWKQLQSRPKRTTVETPRSSIFNVRFYVCRFLLYNLACQMEQQRSTVK